jgi:transposase-like protein
VKGIPQGRYTKEFREEAVKLVTEENLSLPEAARRLSLAPSTLNNWVKKHVHNGIDKLQARSRTHAAIIAAQAGIVGKPVAILLENQNQPD